MDKPRGAGPRDMQMTLLPSQLYTQYARCHHGVSPESESSFTVSIGGVVEDDEGLYRLVIDGQNVLWIPDDAKELRLRLMVCAHMKEAGHRGSAATL